MRPENRYYDVYPKVVPADAETEITIRPLVAGRYFQPDAGTYQITCVPMEELAGCGVRSGPSGQIVRPTENVLRFRQYFEAEQEHVVILETVSGDKPETVARFRVYSLESDLFARRPFKGDLHLHSSYSDGKESPAYVAGACRRIGLDFMAVTDHRKYPPSLEAIEAFRNVPIDLAIYPGEEVHPPDNPVHVVNFGGRYSINDLWAGAKEESHKAEVRAIEAGLPDLPAGVNRRQYASCLWIFNEIRKAGGLGVFCHPYWFCPNQYTPPGPLTSLLLENQPYDALELIGGYWPHEVESNILQVARYHEERAKGRRIPIVGASDAHGCETGSLFGWYYSVVFSPSTRLADLIGSIKGLYSVAVEALPQEAPRAFGPFRLIKYAQFLMREVFLQHDELCVEEGRLMLAHIAGDSSAAELLARLKGRAAALYDRYWGAKS